MKIPLSSRGKVVFLVIVITAVVVIAGAGGLTYGLLSRSSSQASSSNGAVVDADPSDTPIATSDQGPESEPVIGPDHSLYDRVVLRFKGPMVEETSNPNPFMDFRLDCVFRHVESNDTFVIPGFFAADGNAANTDATGGDIWQCLFRPMLKGKWEWTVAFYSGSRVAAGDNLEIAERPDPNGAEGAFQVRSQSDDLPAGDLRRKGFLSYVGKNHRRFDNGEYFISGGTDSPEGLLNYRGFSGMNGNPANTRSWEKHVQDWNDGDPTWRNGNGKGLIGVINYLASLGMNTMSFLTFSALGTDLGVYPTIGDPLTEKERYDVSKLAQWGIVFDHMEDKGMMIHFKLSEVQAVKYLDNGNLGPQRKVYYREMVARFGHYLALKWNLGEEVANDKDTYDGTENQYFITPEQIRGYGTFLGAIDPYDHLIVLHTWPTSEIKVPFNRAVIMDGDNTEIRGFSLQGHSYITSYYDDTKRWVDEGNHAEVPKVVTSDEQGPYEHGILTDGLDPDHFSNRTGVLWPHYMAGGAGHSSYFGFNLDQTDVTVDDMRTRQAWLKQVSLVTAFFQRFQIPFWEMQSSKTMTANGQYVLFKSGSTYIVQIVSQYAATLNLGSDSSGYSVRWYNPRSGGDLQTSTVKCVSGGGFVGLGTAPNDWNLDWIALLRRDPSCDNAGNPYISNGCNGAYFFAEETRLDGPDMRSIAVTFSFKSGTDTNPSGVTTEVDFGQCHCGKSKKLALKGRSITLSCAKPWVVPERACVPSVLAVNGRQCGL